jgi:glycosyltransferase involved in cell wall biosynthesis
MTRRILHVLASPHLGGAEWMCLYLAQEQQARGHDVHVHFFENGVASAKAQEMGLGVTIQNVTTYSRRARWKGLANGLRRLLQTRPPEIVHSHVPLTHLICHRTVPRLKILWVCTMHGSWRQFAYAPQTVRRPYLKPYLLLRHALGDRLATRSAAHVVAISDYVKRELSTIGIAERRMTVVHDGLPPNAHPLLPSDARARLGLPTDSTIIGSLGFFAPVKGFDLLVRAFAPLASQNPRLLLLIAGGDVLGDTSHRQQLVRLISRLGLAERVRLIGSVDPQSGFLAALDIFVVASRSEGFSLSLIEAMQHGLPSVVTSAGGSLEAARPGKEALVFQSGDAADLSRNLENLLLERSMRETLGRSARERAETYLTIERCATDYDLVYNQVLSPPT